MGGHVDHLRDHQDHMSFLDTCFFSLTFICHLSGQESFFVIDPRPICYLEHCPNTYLRKCSNQITFPTIINYCHPHFSTALSSFEPPPMPLVLQQSYIFPTTIRTASVTITERGITHKNLLFGLQTGYILSLPKNYLDPRRKFVSTAEDREEGLHPYIPELMLNPLAFINYNQTGT